MFNSMEAQAEKQASVDLFMETQHQLEAQPDGGIVSKANVRKDSGTCHGPDYLRRKTPFPGDDDDAVLKMPKGLKDWKECGVM